MNKKQISSAGYILKGDYLITSPCEAFIENGAVAVAGNHIAAIGTEKDVIQKFPEFKMFEEKSSIILPGFVNAHTHIAMTLFRGLAEDLPLGKWLEENIFPREKELTKDMVYWGSLLGCSEMIRSGTVCFCDMYIHEESVAEACKISGMKSLLGEGIFDFPSPSYGETENGIKKTKELLEDKSFSGNVIFSSSPHSIYTCSLENIRKLKEISRKTNRKFQIHASETLEENKNSMNNWGLSVIELLEKEDILDSDTLLFHCVWTDENDADIIAETGAVPVICSTSNLKLGSGIPKVELFLKRQIPFCLGTDGPASNNSLDMIGEMKTASLLQKGANMDPELFPSDSVFRAATLNGAKALGFENSGRLAPGSKADIVVLDTEESNAIPLYNPLHHIIFSASSKDIRHCIVDGKFLLKDKKHVTLDIQTIKNEILKIKSFLLKKTLK